MQAILQELHRQGKINDPAIYLRKFKLAELTFKHQIVYDIIERRERYLTEPDDVEGYIDLSFLGTLKEDHMAIMSAEGDIDPMTHQRYEYALNLRREESIHDSFGLKPKKQQSS